MQNRSDISLSDEGTAYFTGPTFLHITCSLPAEQDIRQTRNKKLKKRIQEIRVLKQTSHKCQNWVHR